MEKDKPEINLTTKGMTEQEKEEFLNQHVTRKEVSAFLVNYMTNQLMPPWMEYVQKRLNALLARQSALEAFLISKGIMSEEEFSELLQGLQRPLEPTQPPDKPDGKPPLRVIK